MPFIFGPGLRGLPFPIEQEKQLCTRLSGKFSVISLCTVKHSRLPLRLGMPNATLRVRLILHTDCHIPKVES